jgi:hypothetical protein
MEGEERRRCRMYYEKKEKETIEHMWNGCSEKREKGETGMRETLNEGGREIRRIKEIWKEEGKKRKRKERG